MIQGFLDGKGGGVHRKDRWLTPRHIVDALGSFDLDPAGAPGWELATRTYLPEREEDGLALPWFGRVWLNPPYGRLAESFLHRLVGHGDGIALVFARTETKSFHENIWQQADAVLFLRGRIKFLDEHGVPAPAPAAAPSCLVAYSAENVEALSACGLPGALVRLR